jgi:Ca2+-transporting ATPase
LILTNRSLTRSTWADWWTPNPALRWLGASAVVLLAVILYVPLVRELFHMSRPHLDDMAVIVVAGSGAFVWMEVVKRVLKGWHTPTTT